MDFSPTALALARAVGFKTANLTARRLQEFGASPMATFKLLQYALFPAIIWSLVFIRPDDIGRIFDSPRITIYIACVAVAWNIQVYLNSRVLNAFSSMSGYTAMQKLIALPLLLVIGMLFNKDIPGPLSIVAIGALMAALMLQPAQHKSNHRNRYAMPFVIVAGLMLIRTVIESVDFGLGREILKIVPAEVYLGVFSISALGLSLIWTWFIPGSSQKDDSSVQRQHIWLSALVPILWFAASIPEMFALAVLPIYTVMAIDAVTFGMDTSSDLFRHRTRLNFQTVCFIGLMLAGIILAVFSI